MNTLTPGQMAAVSEFFEILEEVCGSVGRHEGHSLSKAGRCVYCSCGFRYQGTLPSIKERADCAKSYAERQEAS